MSTRRRNACACSRGAAHRVYTGLRHGDAEGRVPRAARRDPRPFKHLSTHDIEAYLASGEWRGKAGGYAIQGRAGAFVTKLVGSYPSVVGLPLYETMSMLAGEGYPVHASWLNTV